MTIEIWVSASCAWTKKWITDRLSRNAADLPWIYQHLQFNGVKIYTPSNGEVSDMQIAFDGVSNPGFVKKLAERVRRGIALAVGDAEAEFTDEGENLLSRKYDHDLVVVTGDQCQE